MRRPHLTDQDFEGLEARWFYVEIADAVALLIIDRPTFEARPPRYYLGRVLWLLLVRPLRWCVRVLRYWPRRCRYCGFPTAQAVDLDAEVCLLFGRRHLNLYPKYARHFLNRWH